MCNKIKCLECSMSIPDAPEDASYEELLCNLCYENFLEDEQRELQAKWDQDNIFNRE